MNEAPGIISKAGITSSGAAEMVSRIKSECADAVQAQSSDFARGARAWDVYKAIDGSQYTDKKLKVFKEEDRHPWQFDFASAKVDTLAGTIVSELPDPDWTPINGQRNTATEAIKESWYIDKELFNYPFVLLETIRDGCVHGGWCQLGESKKYHPAGNISLTRIRPGYLVPDPYWMTSDDNDMNRCWKIGYYTADAMKQVWKKKSEDIDRAIWELKHNKRAIPPDDRQDKMRNLESVVGDEWKVIEYHYVENIERTRLIGLRRGDISQYGRFVWIPFPISTDRDLLERFAEINDIDWESVQETPFTQRVHKVETVTDLDDTLLLENGVSRIQCNGLPFLHYTTTRVDGHDKGVCESVMDLQMMFNERMSHVHELIAKASGGSEVWNEELFRNEQQKQRFVKMGNKPGHKEFAALDDVKHVKEQVGHIQVNPAIFQQVALIYQEVLPLVSRVSDSMSAVSDSEDTGILFERKYQMNRIANILFDKFARQLVNNLGEKYFYQWQQTYADVERELTTRTGDSIVLNKRTDFGIVNSVANVPRCRVIITENTQSASYQMRQRMQIRDVIKSVPEGDYLRLNAVLASYFSSLDLPDRDKAMMDIVNQMNNIKAQAQFMAEMSNLNANTKNSEVMAAQADQVLAQISAMQQQQQMAGQVPEAVTGYDEEIVQPTRHPNEFAAAEGQRQLVLPERLPRNIPQPESYNVP